MLRMTYRLGTTPEPLPNIIDLAAPYGAFPSRGSGCARGPSFVTGKASGGEASSLAAGGLKSSLTLFWHFRARRKHAP
jgi:hypothetical protein